MYNILNKIMKFIVTMIVINLPHHAFAFMTVQHARDTVKVNDEHLVLISKKQ